MIITVNGEEKTVSADTSIGFFTAELMTDERAVVTELNGKIVSDQNTILSEGDVLEIVTFVGGG